MSSSSGAWATAPTIQGAGTTPIVFAVAGDPVVSGYVSNLQRPGGNVTGVTNLLDGGNPQRLRLLKEAAPSINHVAALCYRGGPGIDVLFSAMASEAENLGIRLERFEGQTPDELTDILDAVQALGADAVHVVMAGADALTDPNGRRIVECANSMRLPAA
jgi:putative tryptophan/tyrosine transport system substrate-binding protein